MMHGLLGSSTAATRPHPWFLAQRSRAAGGSSWATRQVASADRRWLRASTPRGSVYASSIQHTLLPCYAPRHRCHSVAQKYEPDAAMGWLTARRWPALHFASARHWRRCACKRAAAPTRGNVNGLLRRRPPCSGGVNMVSHAHLLWRTSGIHSPPALPARKRGGGEGWG